MLLRRQCGDVLLDVRIDASVDERNPCCVPDEPERGSIDDAGVHGVAPFDGQAEPELWLCAKRASVTADITGACAVHGSERTPEGLRRAVTVPDRDAQQVVVALHDIGSGDGHAPPAHVIRQRHGRQRREHPAQVVFGRADCPGQFADVELLGEVLLDKADKLVECRDHEASFRHRS